jgi:prophage antirepressor-like protein
MENNTIETVGKIFSIFEDFTYDGVTLNIINILDYIWFRAKDITAVLGYKNTTDPIQRHIDDEDKKKLKDIWVRDPRTHDFDRQNQDHALYITESGVYDLIFASKLPTAKEFKRWITGTVIPSIRRTGQYQNQELINRVQKLELENQNKDDVIKSTRTQNRSLRKDVAKLTTFKIRHHNTMKAAQRIERNGWIYIVANPSDFNLEIFKVGMTTESDPKKRLCQYGTGYSKLSTARRIMEWPVFGPRTMESKISEHLKPYKQYDRKELYQLPLGTLIKTIDYFITNENKVINFTNKVRQTLNNASDDEKIAKGDPEKYETLFNTIHEEYLNAGSPDNMKEFYDYLHAYGINISGFKWLVKIIVRSIHHHGLKV